MTEWILPCRPASENEKDNNVYRYDIDAAYESGKPIYWLQHNRFEEGDMIYIYESSPSQKIKYLFKVISTYIPAEEIDYDEAYENMHYEPLEDDVFAEFIGIGKYSCTGLSFNDLKNHGLKGNLQGAIKLTGELREYIKRFCFI